MKSMTKSMEILVKTIEYCNGEEENSKYSKTFYIPRMLYDEKHKDI